MTEQTDRIEKQVLLQAPIERVWSAIADSEQFGTWFGVKFEGPFVAGTKLLGKIVPTKVDADVAKMQEPHTGTPFTCWIEKVEPKHHFSFRWHPYAIEPGMDYSTEPTTLVSFDLKEENGGTKLTISESGFDQIPLERRAQAFAANDGGWTHQSKLIEKYLNLSVKR